MKELFDLILNKELLTISNFVLAFCIVFHLVCEFIHYIHEFLSRRKDGKKLTRNNELLTDILERIEQLEKVHAENGSCPLKKNGDKNYANEKIYVETSSKM